MNQSLNGSPILPNEQLQRPEYTRTYREIQHNPRVEAKRHVMHSNRKMRHQQEIQGIPNNYRAEGLHEVSDRLGPTPHFTAIAPANIPFDA